MGEIVVRTPDNKIHKFPEGTTPEQAMSALSSYLGPGGFAPMTPEQTEAGLAMNRPKAMTQRWLRTGPYVGGALGALAIKNPRGAGLGAEAVAGLMQMLGAGVGGSVGRAVEHQAGGTWPEADAEKWRSLGKAFLQQSMLQSPASAVGVAGEGLVGLRGMMRHRAETKAAKEVVNQMVARRKARIAGLEREIPVASESRKEAANRTAAAIKASGENITLEDLVGRIVEMREARVAITGRRMSPQTKDALTNEVRKRVASVVRKQTGGVVRPPAGRKRSGRLVDQYGRTPQSEVTPPAEIRYDMPISQVSKQTFDDLMRAANAGREGGVKPRPGTDIDIADAFRSLIEDNVDEVRGLNRATQGRIRSEKALKGMQKRLPPDEQFTVQAEEAAAAARERVRANRSANPLTMFKGIPVRGGIATPGFTIRPGGLSEFGGKMGEAMASAPMEQAMMWSPRAYALFLEWKRQVDEDAARLGAPADITNPQPRAAKEE